MNADTDRMTPQQNMPESRPHTPRPEAPAGRTGLLALIGLLLVLGFAFQGSRGLWSTDEGRYTDNALQMIDSGHYLLPAYAPGMPNYSKPPMTAWAIAGSIRVFGRNAWAARAPYALAFVFSALLLYVMGRTLVPDKPWLPALVYACAVFPFLAANVVSTDGLLALFETLAATGFVRAFFDARPRVARTGPWLMWLGFGLAFLTKGPPGLIPLLGMLPFVARRDGWSGMRRLFSPLGLGIFAVSGLTWYLLVVIRVPGLLHYYLHYEVYDRVFTATQHRHGQWYGWIVVYVPVLGLGSLPWWPALGRVARDAVSGSRWRERWRQPTPRLFLLLWLLVPLAVFCLARSRLPLYLLPLFVPLALLLALELRERFDLRRTRLRAVLGLWIALLVAGKGLAAYTLHPDSDNALRARQLNAVTAGAPYDALIFLHATASRHAVFERTPWGLRLYLHRVVYGVAWSGPERMQHLCGAIAGRPAVLLAADGALRPDAVRAALDQCPGHPQDAPIGHWRRYNLIMVRN